MKGTQISARALRKNLNPSTVACTAFVLAFVARSNRRAGLFCALLLLLPSSGLRSDRILLLLVLFLLLPRRRHLLGHLLMTMMTPPPLDVRFAQSSSLFPFFMCLWFLLDLSADLFRAFCSRRKRRCWFRIRSSLRGPSQWKVAVLRDGHWGS
ncbi:hypothetical protein BHE74_00019054 [Ensete ventricosum]|nr:hypothetical protein BHE74_00019054 [Ensete ventricosum]